jgi:aspartate/methionine/tyrosine aminotransferase
MALGFCCCWLRCFRQLMACVCSDEIYANSIFKEADFVSMVNILDKCEPGLQVKGEALCHVVWGLSKDWWGPSNSHGLTLGAAHA